MTFPARLSALRNRDGGWGYVAGNSSRIEPTCWGLLALASVKRTPIDPEPLMLWPRREGWLIDVEGAPVNYAFNALAALALRTHRSGEAEAVRIAQSLLEVRGVKLAQGTEIRQDNSLQGWPWIDATFSWLEPTSWCVLLLKLLRQRLPSNAVSARISVGEKMIIDRACAVGGWNYGGSNVYGQELYPYVPTTAIALLAMQDRRSEPVVTRGVDWMRKEALSEPSLNALALARLASGIYGAQIPGLQDTLSKRLEDSASDRSLGFSAAVYAAIGASNGDTTFSL